MRGAALTSTPLFLPPSTRPRDAWKYANLYRNALAVVEANSSSGVANNSVLIVAPSELRGG
jgi:hypothetical protein